jgi:calcineurin-like phosphoesterase family protein
VCNFLRADGTKLRPWDHPDEMDEEMFRRWNETVRPNDKVYHLGDVVINRKALKTLGRLNGDKVLIKGNHDIFRLDEYTQYFRDIRAYHVMNGLILSHIPIHEESIARFGCNIHGHLHDRRVMMTKHKGAKPTIDPRYFSACVEQHDFRPVLFEDAMKQIVAQGGSVGFKARTDPSESPCM